MKRVSFKTVGCRLNQAETAQMAAGFESVGYRVVPFGAACDACVIHSCAITDTAEKKSCAYARRAAGGRRQPIVVLAGCAAETSSRDLQRVTGAHLVVGQADKFRIPQLLEERALMPPDSEPAEAAAGETGSIRAARMTRALVKVEDGCNFRCAYCVVPNARGEPRSRSLDEVRREVRDLSDRGFREVVLTGANLGLYRDGSKDLVDLLDAVESVSGLDRIRISSVELSTVERALVDAMAESQKLCPALHLPLQSGDDRILSAMKRRYTAAQYRAFVEYALRRIPRLGLGTDVIAGFPGEDDDAFQSTLSLVEALPFSNLHVFPFSEREGTCAADMEETVTIKTRKERAALLIKAGERRRYAFAGQFAGECVSVLIEDVDAHGVGSGWTGEYLRARVHRDGLKVNDIVECVPRWFDRRQGVLECGEVYDAV